MKELKGSELSKVNGGLPPAVVALVVVAVRHYTKKAVGAAVAGATAGAVKAATD